MCSSDLVLLFVLCHRSSTNNVYSGFLDMAGRYLLLGRAAHDGRPQSRKTTPHPTLYAVLPKVFAVGSLQRLPAYCNNI